MGLTPLVVAIDELRAIVKLCASKKSRADRFAYSDGIKGRSVIILVVASQFL